MGVTPSPSVCAQRGRGQTHPDVPPAPTHPNCLVIFYIFLIRIYF